MLYDGVDAASKALAGRLREHYPKLVVRTGSNDPAGFDLVVNATPLGMKESDPLPFDIARVDARTFVGEVVMKQRDDAAAAGGAGQGCPFQVGTDMLFEMIPAYLEFFGFGTATRRRAARGVADPLLSRRSPRPMRRSIATVSMSGTLRQKLEAIAAARFDGIELFENDFVNFDGSAARPAAMAADLGLAIDLYQPFRDFEGMPDAPVRATSIAPSASST